MTNDTKASKTNNYNDEPVWYCTKCLSLNIVTNEDHTDLYCADCGRKRTKPQDIDFTSIYKWMKLYEKAYGHHPLADDPNPYDDWKEVYDEDTYNPEPTKDEIYEAGLNYSERMNRKIKE